MNKIDDNSMRLTSNNQDQSRSCDKEQLLPHEESVSLKQLMIASVVCILSTCIACFSSPSVQVLGGAVPEFELNAW